MASKKFTFAIFSITCLTFIIYPSLYKLFFNGVRSGVGHVYGINKDTGSLDQIDNDFGCTGNGFQFMTSLTNKIMYECRYDGDVGLFVYDSESVRAITNPLKVSNDATIGGINTNQPFPNDNNVIYFKAQDDLNDPSIWTMHSYNSITGVISDIGIDPSDVSTDILIHSVENGLIVLENTDSLGTVSLWRYDTKQAAVANTNPKKLNIGNIEDSVYGLVTGYDYPTKWINGEQYLIGYTSGYPRIVKISEPSQTLNIVDVSINGVPVDGITSIFKSTKKFNELPPGVAGLLR